MVLKRRIESLERTWPRRRSFVDLVTEGQNLVRLTGMTADTAIARLLEGASTDELNQMDAEAEAMLGPCHASVNPLEPALERSKPTEPEAL